MHFTHLNVRVSRFQRHLAASPPRALHGHVPWSTQGVARPAPSSSPSRKGVLPAASDVRVPAPFAGAFLIFCFDYDGDVGLAQHGCLMMLPMVCGLPCVPAIRASASPARAPILAHSTAATIRLAAAERVFATALVPPTPPPVRRSTRL